MNKSIAMIFDVETTGLIYGKVVPKLDACPYVLQCSYVIFDMETHKILKTMNSYVNIAQDVVIPPESTRIHGITREMCNTGRQMCDILNEFYNDYHNMANVLVAHNLKFDATLLNIEYQRNWPKMRDTCPYALNLFQPVYMNDVNMRQICTMEFSTEMCKLPFPSGKGGGYKFPTLLELYRHLFHKTPDHLHDSMMDCLVCLRCFLKISGGGYEMEEYEFERTVSSLYYLGNPIV
jgi:DNA polymerase III epsilon subunit-like protein